MQQSFIHKHDSNVDKNQTDDASTNSIVLRAHTKIVIYSHLHSKLQHISYRC